MILEVFFDYACPFCKQGHEYLRDVLPQFDEVEVIWRPCEAHPRPERYGLHSDLCARGMYIIQEQGANLEEYHEHMYQAALSGNCNIEDTEVLAGLIEGLADGEMFRHAMSSGSYSEELAANNQEAWGTHQFAAVPSLVMNKQTLGAVPNVGLTKEMIEQFLQQSRKG